MNRAQRGLLSKVCVCVCVVVHKWKKRVNKQPMTLHVLYNCQVAYISFAYVLCSGRTCLLMHWHPSAALLMLWCDDQLVKSLDLFSDSFCRLFSVLWMSNWIIHSTDLLNTNYDLFIPPSFINPLVVRQRWSEMTDFYFICIYFSQ